MGRIASCACTRHAIAHWIGERGRSSERMRREVVWRKPAIKPKGSPLDDAGWDAVPEGLVLRLIKFPYPTEPGNTARSFSQDLARSGKTPARRACRYLFAALGYRTPAPRCEDDDEYGGRARQVTSGCPKDDRDGCHRLQSNKNYVPGCGERCRLRRSPHELQGSSRHSGSNYGAISWSPKMS